MAFNIKDDATVERLRELAKLDGTSMSSAAAAAIAVALRERKEAEHDIVSDLLAIGREARKHMSAEFLATTQKQLDDEIYDPETGLPW